jgi:hypothetical protein
MKRLNMHSLIPLQKVNRLLKAVPAYIEKYGRDPSALLCEQHMSDAASGPEDNSNESRADWKTRMAAEKGIELQEAIAKLKFLEVIKPEWQSVQVCVNTTCNCYLSEFSKLTEIMHELHGMWWANRSIREKEKINAIIINTTSRSTSVPPLQAPYDFGIDQEWWKTAKEKYPEHVKDWYTYGNPAEFGGDETEHADDEWDRMDNRLEELEGDQINNGL